MPFRDRRDAGMQLAALLGRFRAERPVVLALPRGGVPVAFEVARALQAPLDVIVVRKLGLPHQPELAMGAIGEDGVRVVNEDLCRSVGVSAADLAAVERRERAELERRATRFRGGRPPVRVAGRTAIVVDDGLATGSTALAALQVVRAHGAGRVILAVPVAPPETLRSMEGHADEVVCVQAPPNMSAIGFWYDDFGQTSDDEVVRLLDAARSSADSSDTARSAGDPPGSGGPAERDEEVELLIGSTRLGSHLTVPAGAVGLVVFAHGSGSSRRSPRNQYVATVLQEGGLATLLFDLLTEAESLDRRNVFDVPLLASRLSGAIDAIRTDPELAALPIGAFGASTGAAAALWAAGDLSSPIAAVVSRGGRPDLAAARLSSVRAPTLLVVGGADTEVLDLNRQAAAHLTCTRRVQVVPGAPHLFDEPGTLAAAASLARDWLVTHLSAAHPPQTTRPEPA